MNELKYFSATYTDFIKFDRKSNEDFYLISEKLPIFVIADGVTQSHFKGGEYAFPAGAQTTAKIFCYTVLEFLEKNFENKDFQGLIENAFNLANQKIKEFNIAEGIDKRLNYLEYDWFDCVSIAGFIIKNNLYYGYVGDCGLIIFDKDNKLKFQTKDEVLPAIKRIKKICTNWENLPKEQRKLIIQRDFRNRPDGKGYGSFTGGEGVKKYYEIGSKNLKEKDLIVFYSDGFLNYLKFPEFIEILRKQDKKSLDEFTIQKAKEDYEKYGTDRTFIASGF
jgi:serine/threonine protein phosphatase PrpC